MSETIYVLTILYCAYVLDEVEGDRFVAFSKDVLHIDLSQVHKTYRNLRDSLLNSINFRSVSVAWIELR